MVGGALEAEVTAADSAPSAVFLSYRSLAAELIRVLPHFQVFPPYVGGGNPL